MAELMKRVESNDASAMFALGTYHSQGLNGLQQDQAKATQLWTQAVRRGSSKAHFQVGFLFDQGGDMKKPSSTSRLLLWQETKGQDSNLE
jgi:TPR repeat protein